MQRPDMWSVLSRTLHFDTERLPVCRTREWLHSSNKYAFAGRSSSVDVVWILFPESVYVCLRSKACVRVSVYDCVNGREIREGENKRIDLVGGLFVCLVALCVGAPKLCTAPAFLKCLGVR